MAAIRITVTRIVIAMFFLLLGSAAASMADALAANASTIILSDGESIPNFGAHPTIVSMGSGNWSNPFTWSPRRVPGANDIVDINPGTTIIYDTVNTATNAPATVAILDGGTLTFSTNTNTTLNVTNLLVMPASTPNTSGGTLIVGTALNPVAANVTAQIIFSDTAVNTATDPAQYGNGLIGLGTVTMHGAVKTSWAALAVEPLAGNTILTFATPITGWMPGDKLYLEDTQQMTSHQVSCKNGGPCYGATWVPEGENPKVASVSPNGLTVTLAGPLQYSHPGAHSDTALVFPPKVANLSHNIVIKSANVQPVYKNASGVVIPNTTVAAKGFDKSGIASISSHRAYTMFADHANVDIEYVEFAGMGRTANYATIPQGGTVGGGVPQGSMIPVDGINDDTTVGKNGVVNHIGVNQSGRYPVTFNNLTGPAKPQPDGYQFTFAHNAVFCPVSPMPFRWGIDIDKSNFGLIQDNAFYNWAGAGIIVAETGTETGNVLDHNFVAQISGTGVRDDGTLSYYSTHKGYANGGYGIWSGNFSNKITNNFVANATYDNYDIYARANDRDVPPAVIPSLGFFVGNEACCSEIGLSIWFLNASDKSISSSTAVSTVQDFSVWHTWQYGFYGYPTSNLTFNNYRVYDDPANLSNTYDAPTAFYFSDYLTNNFTLTNSTIYGARTGISALFNGEGTLTIANSTFEVGGDAITVDSPSGFGSNPDSLNVTGWKTVINNDKFISLPGNVGGVPEVAVGMRYGIESNCANLVVPQTVFVTNYNGVPGDNFQVFYNEQAANFVVPQSVGTKVVGSPVAGLTNAQNLAKYGIAIAGAVAPPGVVAAPAVGGGVVLLASSAPKATPPPPTPVPTPAPAPKPAAPAPALVVAPSGLTASAVATGLTVKFTASATGTSPITYSWRFGDGATGSGAAASHTYTAGSFTATVTATNAAGSVSKSVTVTVKPAYPLTVSTSASVTAGVAPLEVKFTSAVADTADTATKVIRNFGDGVNVTNGPNPATHTYAKAGSYTATETVTDSEGHTASSSTTLSVY